MPRRYQEQTVRVAISTPEKEPPYVHINIQPLGTLAFAEQKYYEMDVTKEDKFRLPCFQVRGILTGFRV